MKTNLVKTLLLTALAFSLMTPVLARWSTTSAQPAGAATKGPKPGTTGFAPAPAVMHLC
jgi:hypothetical protein